MTDDQQPDRPATGPSAPDERADRPAAESSSGDRQADSRETEAASEVGESGERPGAARRSTLGDPGMPAAGRRPADEESVRSGHEGSDPYAPVDPHAPLSPDGPTIRLAGAMLPPPGDEAALNPKRQGRTADVSAAAGEEDSGVSRPDRHDDEATTLLTPPAEVDEEPTVQVTPHALSGTPVGESQPAASEPARPAERRSFEGGSTMRLQPPFFAPGTTRTPRAAPPTDSAPEAEGDTPNRSTDTPWPDSVAAVPPDQGDRSGSDPVDHPPTGREDQAGAVDAPPAGHDDEPWVSAVDDQSAGHENQPWAHAAGQPWEKAAEDLPARGDDQTRVDRADVDPAAQGDQTWLGRVEASPAAGHDETWPGRAETSPVAGHADSWPGRAEVPPAAGHDETWPGRAEVSPTAERDDWSGSADVVPAARHDETWSDAADGPPAKRDDQPWDAVASPGDADRKPATDGSLGQADESREPWQSSPAGPDRWPDTSSWPVEDAAGPDVAAEHADAAERGHVSQQDDHPGGSVSATVVGERDTPERWHDNMARAAAAADVRDDSVRGTPGTSPEPVTAAAGNGQATAGSGPADAGDGAVAVPDKEKAPAGRRLSSAGALIWLLLALLGFTLAVQLRSNDQDAGLATARQEDLVGILSDLEARDQRLQQEINALEESQRQLTSGVAGREAALAEAGKRADELGLLSGTLPARGPGLKIFIDPKGQPIKASAILNAVQELRGAGGEVMEIIGDNGVAVRIVASSYFVDGAGGQVIVDGKQLSGPYTLWVIGVPSTMQTALQIPGGVVASVSQAGGNVTMEQRTAVEVTAVRQPTSLQYARPVS
ncbi:DUF881 domain-containing protein [Actinoplanes auranticolor]|uniref:DUF881 domain-containing protein n=1 Tax=Actinoplanes auranticolor TaxID=47988 RepID=A0A919S3N5_9ACTN|nr:DUF881 domain-containing protein [Actinoplanes auranticolor]GIM63436.1 hypothetical protein Aau02nite_04020 [Actinoplanes auranticolor]